ncbi:MAG: aldose 1-epimerase family protein [Clostridia bacterium]|nr:aldose 1-epimerase family protein [Clostridia bacterium]
MDTIELRYGQTRAVVQTTGAQIASFKGADGREVIWQADPAVWAQHAPVLFPVCGTAKDNQVTVDGISYPMTKHGFTRNPDFTVGKRGADFVELVLGPTEESRPMYPFDFRLHVVYRLFENGYTTQFLVENLSDRPMPFCVGGHPGFVCPMEEGAAFEDYQLVFDEKEDGKNLLAPGGGLISGDEILPLEDGRILSLKYSYFDERDALIFDSYRSRAVNLTHRETGRGLRFEYPKMEVLAVWTKPGAHAPYLCLEPWHGLPATAAESGRFEDKPHATVLQPGESYTTWFTVRLMG